MKTRLLPELDLARIAPLPADQKRLELKKLKLGHPPYSYGPSRSAIPDLLNIDAGPLGRVHRAKLSELEGVIGRRSKNDDERNANIAVARALYNFTTLNKIEGRRESFLPLAVGVSEKITFWCPAIFNVSGRPFAFFVDPRKTKKLTPKGRKFVFSAMHERIRVVDPDFADVELAILQLQTLAKGSEATRLVRQMNCDNNLYSFQELDDMVRETYEIWMQVQTERAEEAMKATGTAGPLFK